MFGEVWQLPERNAIEIPPSSEIMAQARDRGAERIRKARGFLGKIRRKLRDGVVSAVNTLAGGDVIAQDLYARFQDWDEEVSQGVYDGVDTAADAVGGKLRAAHDGINEAGARANAWGTDRKEKLQSGARAVGRGAVSGARAVGRGARALHDGINEAGARANAWGSQARQDAIQAVVDFDHSFNEGGSRRGHVDAAKNVLKAEGIALASPFLAAGAVGLGLYESGKFVVEHVPDAVGWTLDQGQRAINAAGSWIERGYLALMERTRLDEVVIELLQEGVQKRQSLKGESLTSEE